MAKSQDVAPSTEVLASWGIANGIPDFLDIRIKTKELHDLDLWLYLRCTLAFDMDNHIGSRLRGNSEKLKSLNVILTFTHTVELENKRKWDVQDVERKEG